MNNELYKIQEAMLTLEAIRTPVVFIHPDDKEEIEKSEGGMPENILLIPEYFIEKGNAIVVTDMDLKKDIIRSLKK